MKIFWVGSFGVLVRGLARLIQYIIQNV